ncbi:MAG TPA: helix-turn-helix domain-containing protein [Bacteroidota bacterium]|nr:helix-turn-helix domain-containing protein [Bacteroidota bacterium]
MLKINLRRFFAGRAITNPGVYLQKQGFSRRFAADAAAGTMKKISFADLEQLCRLFECTPHDVLEWVPSANESNAASSPLAPLIRTDTSVDLLGLLNSLPYNKLEEMQKLIAEKAKQR